MADSKKRWCERNPCSLGRQSLSQLIDPVLGECPQSGQNRCKQTLGMADCAVKVPPEYHLNAT